MSKRGFGKRIRDAREARGLTQEELGERVGLSGTQISRIESESQQPSVPAHVNALVNVLPISAEELLMAMGVSLSVPAAGRLPRQLLEDLAALPPDQMAAIALLAHASAAASSLPPGQHR